MILRQQCCKSPQGSIKTGSKRNRIDVMTPAQAGSLGFGAFLLNMDRRALTYSGQPVPLTPKAFEVLRVLALAGYKSKVVSRNELVDSVWGETIVEESNLTQTIFLLRQALRHFDVNEYIETVPRQGYLFRGDVRIIPNASAGVGAREIRLRWPPRRGWAGGVASPIVFPSLAAIGIWREATAPGPETRGPGADNLYPSRPQF